MNPSLNELTTAATDAAVAALCVTLSWRLQSLPGARWKKGVWTWVFVLLVVASALGAVAHGFDLSAELRSAIWQPLYLSLGLTVALFVVGAVGDWQGESAARALLPPAIGVGVTFFAISRLADGSFLVFVAYEGVGMVTALAIYVFLAMQRRLPGAIIVSVGIGLTIAAAAVQTTDWQIRLIVPFDHNGLFHLVQMASIPVIGRGIRQGLAVTAPG